MSISENAQKKCKEEWIEHACDVGNACTRHIGRGRGKNRVSVSLEGAPVPHVVVDLDSVDSKCIGDSEVADYLLFVDQAADTGGWVVPIEISHGKNKEVKKIKGQLESSAALAQENVVGGKDAVLVPVFVGCTRNARRLQKTKVVALGNEYSVRVLRSREKIAPYLM